MTDHGREPPGSAFADLPVEHHKLDVDGVRLHYVEAGAGPPLFLIHGFPQTWWEWRAVMPQLAQRYRVIAVDYRGAGSSARTHAGYDKRTMGADVRKLAQRLCGDRPVHVVGHDMGSFVAAGWALDRPETVASLTLIDAPVLGTPTWDAISRSPNLWHVQFHGARDVAEMLVAGRERAYIEQFVRTRLYRDDAFSVEDFDVYERAYAAAGAFRAAFEAYRALPEDVERQRRILATRRLEMPVLVVAGAMSNTGPVLEAMLPEFAADARCVVVEQAGHWIPEEQPACLLAALEPFLAGAAA